MKHQAPLTNIQLELLKLFSLNLSVDELSDVKIILSRYFSDSLSKRVDYIWQKDGLTEKDMENWLNDQNQ